MKRPGTNAGLYGLVLTEENADILLTLPFGTIFRQAAEDSWSRSAVIWLWTPKEAKAGGDGYLGELGFSETGENISIPLPEECSEQPCRVWDHLPPGLMIIWTDPGVEH